MRARISGSHDWLWLLLLVGLIACLCVAASYPYQPEQPTIVKHYRSGLMEQVAQQRGLTKPDGVDGYAAVNDCSWLGGVVLLSIKDSPVESYFVVDCSAPEDRQRHLDEGLIAEIDFQSAFRHGFAWDNHNYFGNGQAYAVLVRYYPAGTDWRQ